MLTESVLLSGLGGAAGLLLGYLGRNAIPGMLANSSRLDMGPLQFDWRVLLFALGISLATGILFDWPRQPGRRLELAPMPDSETPAAPPPIGTSFGWTRVL